MKKTTLALAVAATLALGACGSGGGSEPAKTVTKTAASDGVPADNADDSASEDDPMGDLEGTDKDLWGNLPMYTDAYALSQAIGSGYWEVDPDGMTEFDCIKANQQSTQERDEFSGEIVDVTYLECSREGTSELATLTVADDASEDIAVPICDEFFEGDTCFTGKGWTIDAQNTAMLKEMLEKIDVDHEAWGVGEDLGY